ncbi:MAG: hypothetical protein N3D73_03020 [Candidatus Diapherotrites archaeon]|nr:hypothetical protein [Candidatus Diapherotrites archaeon]
MKKYIIVDYSNYCPLKGDELKVLEVNMDLEYIKNHYIQKKRNFLSVFSEEGECIFEAEFQCGGAPCPCRQGECPFYPFYV